MKQLKLLGLGALALALFAGGLLINQKGKESDSPPVLDTNPLHTSVKVTNFAGNSGGSGTVISSSATSSLVLTNGHVCGVVKAGGRITTEDQRTYLVDSYALSDEHDLCLISVASDLKRGSNLASRAPIATKENGTIIGHPRLYPTIVTSGPFADNMIIDVMIGVRECTDADRANPDRALMCAFFGVAPIIKMYESTLVSATIMPGSSGSGVFNAAGELQAVVFAGGGDLSYGMLVPYEYVNRFLTRGSYNWQKPLEGDAAKHSEEQQKIFKQIISYCRNNNNAACQQVRRNTLEVR